MENINREVSLNNTLYYWDRFLVKGDEKYILCAHFHMQQYRKFGGLDHKETETRINMIVRKL